MPDMNSGTKTGTIIKVSGPLVVAEGMTGAKMYDVVRVSEKRLIGEILLNPRRRNFEFRGRHF